MSSLASLIENKCDDVLPIHRQRGRLLRLGFDVPLGTLDEYWAQATALLSPVAKTTLSTVLGEPYAERRARARARTTSGRLAVRR